MTFASSAVQTASEKIVRILLAAAGANQIQARGCAAGEGRNREYATANCADRDRLCRFMEGSLMKKNPQNVRNIEQKETKLTKAFWRAELRDATDVQNRSVTGSQEFAPPFIR